MVVEGDMNKLTAGPGRGLGSIRGHQIPWTTKAPEFLDVEVELVARRGMFITHDRGGGFE